RFTVSRNNPHKKVLSFAPTFPSSSLLITRLRLVLLRILLRGGKKETSAMAPLRRAASAAAVLLALTGLFLLVLSPADAATAAVEGGELRMKQSDGGYSYNSTLAHILVEYASAVYTSDLTSLLKWTCPRCEGHTKGFQMIEIIVDVEKCLQGFCWSCP
uniref:Uncharacterized protein n=1 Tax=Aegilops tauschii subsp. strangulata TaxID=200361 RepID=A0A453HVW4_AEGTS